MRRRLPVVFAYSVLAGAVLLAAQIELHLDVPYVPTRPEVVARMLEMAGVGKNDVLYDLGCGDGRIVITAALRYGTRGVGIDINPERINESRENAAKANVTGLVRFVRQDLFQTDFHDASVVTLYLLTSVNLRLRPILFAQLRPGARVVSHDFSMDSWTPDASDAVTAGGRSHSIFFWIIPANVSGTWEWTWPGNPTRPPCRLDIEQHFQMLTGRFRVGDRDIPLKELKISGDRISFSAEKDGHGASGAVRFDARVLGDSMEGTMSGEGGGNVARKPWTAKRNPFTKKAIDTGGGAGLGSLALHFF